jgi:hypothetical protein
LEIEDLPGADPNTLPYFITEAQTSRVIPVRFEALTAEDVPELTNEDWVQAVFAAAWRQYVYGERVLKLVCVAAEDQRIQGLLHLGSLDTSRVFLIESLLETAPFNRSNTSQQNYNGVGRVLVARLVVESVQIGGHGRVVVQPRSGTASFYETIGFKALPAKRRYILDTAQAKLLLESVCIASE